MLLYIALFLLWMILNGKITQEIILFGLGISAALTWFSYRFLGYGGNHTKRTWRYYLLALGYGGCLLWEVLKANAAVFRIVLAKDLSFEPVLVSFTPGLKETRSWVILANSITLTPGTITVEMKDGNYLVHCLDRSLAEGISENIFVRMLKRMEEETA